MSIIHNGVNFYILRELPLNDHVLTINVATATSESDYWLVSMRLASRLVGQGRTMFNSAAFFLVCMY